MQQRKSSLRLFLCIFSGEDKTIIKKSDTFGAKNIFAAIGTFVIFIFLGCFISAFQFSHSLFQEKLYISLPIGIIWALVVVNMYLLLLYTVSPAILPHRKNKNGSKSNVLSLSMLFRTGFISLLAIIIAQPLNVMFFSDSIQPSLRKHIEEEKTKMIIAADNHLIKNEIELFQEFNRQLRTKLTSEQIDEVMQNIKRIDQKIKSDIEFINTSNILLKKLLAIENQIIISSKDNLLRNQFVSRLSKLVNDEIESDKLFIIELDEINVVNKNLEVEFNQCKISLTESITSKLSNYAELDFLLSQTNFYIKRIQLILFENYLSWFVTFGVCLLFLLPIYLKYKVRNMTDFYTDKIEIETKIVLDEYESFKKIYSKILMENISKYNFNSLTQLRGELHKVQRFDVKKYSLFDKQMSDEYRDEIISRYEYWADNPFRTIRKYEQKLELQTPISMMDFLYNETENNSES